MANKLIVTAAPHITSADSTQKIMQRGCIALLPALVASVIIFGINALIITVVTVAACVIFEYLYCKLVGREVSIGDFSAVVTGLLLAAIYATAQSTLSTGLNSVASSWTLDIQERLSKKKLSFETQTKIGQYVSLLVGIFSIVVAMVLANGGVKSAYEWFNGFMGLVLGILIGSFILGAFTKVANTFGTTLAFIAASAVMVFIKYGPYAADVSIWSYSIISIAVSLVVGIPASMIWRAVKGDKSVPAPNTTIYKN